MSNEPGTRTFRYEAIIATLVGISALFVSGYTAYVQRQQVRAAVWPILEFSTGNEPNIRFYVENKGVGPAIVRHVIVTVDGEPVRNWSQALQKLIGPGKYNFTQSTISGHVFSAGEAMSILVPKEPDGSLMSGGDKPESLFKTLDKERGRVGIEVCYSSTLGESWILRGGAAGNSTTEIGTCPGSSDKTFQQ